MEYRMSNKKYHFDSQSHNSSSQFKEVKQFTEKQTFKYL